MMRIITLILAGGSSFGVGRSLYGAGNSHYIHPVDIEFPLPSPHEAGDISRDIHNREAYERCEKDWEGSSKEDRERASEYINDHLSWLWREIHFYLELQFKMMTTQ